jgi:hypothetical protein
MVHRVHVAPADGDGHFIYEFFLFWDDEFHNDIWNLNFVENYLCKLSVRTIHANYLCALILAKIPSTNNTLASIAK